MKFFDLIPPHFTIQTEEWSADDDSSLREYLSSHSYVFLRKKIQRRLVKLTEDLVNGEDTRGKIEELKDLILELDDYANPS